MKCPKELIGDEFSFNILQGERDSGQEFQGFLSFLFTEGIKTRAVQQVLSL
jgi:hypothetical protein